MKKYLIVYFQCEEICGIVDAKSSKEALKTLFESQDIPEDFVKDVYCEGSFNGFWEKFGIEACKKCNYEKRCSNKKCEGGSIHFSKKEILKKIDEYFPEKSWVELYQKIYFSPKESLKINLPQEMLRFCWIKEQMEEMKYFYVVELNSIQTYSRKKND